MVHLVLVGAVSVLAVRPSGSTAPSSTSSAPTGSSRPTRSASSAASSSSPCPSRSGWPRWSCPLQVGASTIAFPRAAAAAAWTYLIGGGLLLGRLRHRRRPRRHRHRRHRAVRRGVRARARRPARGLDLPRDHGVRAAGAGPAAHAGCRCSPGRSLVAGGVWILTLPVLGGLLGAQLPRRPLRRLPRQHRDRALRPHRLGLPPARRSTRWPSPRSASSARSSRCSPRPATTSTASPSASSAPSARSALGAWTAPSLEGDLPWLYDGRRGSSSRSPRCVPVLGLVGLWAPHRCGRAGRCSRSPLLFAVATVLLLLLGLAAGAVQAHRADRDDRRRHQHHAVRHGLVHRRHRARPPRHGRRPARRRRLLGAQDRRLAVPGGRRPPRRHAAARSAPPSAASPSSPPACSASPGTVALAAAEHTDLLETLGLVTTVADGVLVLGRAASSSCSWPGPPPAPTDPGDDPWAATRSSGPPRRRRRSATSPRCPKITSEAPLYDARHGAEEADA